MSHLRGDGPTGVPAEKRKIATPQLRKGRPGLLAGRDITSSSHTPIPSTKRKHGASAEDDVGPGAADWPPKRGRMADDPFVTEDPFMAEDPLVDEDPCLGSYSDLVELARLKGIGGHDAVVSKLERISQAAIHHAARLKKATTRAAARAAEAAADKAAVVTAAVADAHAEAIMDGGTDDSDDTPTDNTLTDNTLTDKTLTDGTLLLEEEGSTDAGYDDRSETLVSEDGWSGDEGAHGHGHKLKEMVEVEEDEDEEAAVDLTVEPAPSDSDLHTSTETGRSFKITAAKAQLRNPKVRKGSKIINKAPTTVMDVFVFGAMSAGQLGLECVRPNNFGDDEWDDDDGEDDHDGAHGPRGRAVAKMARLAVPDVSSKGEQDETVESANDEGQDGEEVDEDGKTGGTTKDVTAEDLVASSADLSANDNEDADDDDDDDDDDTGDDDDDDDAVDFNPDPAHQEALITDWRRYFQMPAVQTTPALNTNLPEAGVVQLACGGRHVVALTADNRIFTWGNNLLGQLGRDTAPLESLVPDYDAAEGEENPDRGRGRQWRHDPPREDKFPGVVCECVPGAVSLERVEEDVVWTQVLATEATSVALTQYGDVYEWGTYRGVDGAIGMGRDEPNTPIVAVPTRVVGLRKVRKLGAGGNHLLAVDVDGKVWAWGAGGNGQLARKQTPSGLNALKPETIGKLKVPPAPGAPGATSGAGRLTDTSGFLRKSPSVTSLEGGSMHSLALLGDGRLLSWGCNSLGQLGIQENDAKKLLEIQKQGGHETVMRPRVIPRYNRVVANAVGQKEKDVLVADIADIAGGEFHSVAVTKTGKLLAWGRADGNRLGFKMEADSGQDTTVFDAVKALYDDAGRPRVLPEPTMLRGDAFDEEFFESVSAGWAHNMAVTKDGRVFVWGMGNKGQTGLGDRQHVEMPTLLDFDELKNRVVLWAGGGEEFSVLGVRREKEN